MTLFVIVTAVICSWYYFSVVVPRRKERERFDKALGAYNTERDRVEALPRLDTRWLMRVPGEIMDKNSICRSYGTRYDRIFIVDECGNGWVGLVTPEILKDLTAGEYIRCNYFIPFRGDGESSAGKPVTVDNQIIYVYPIWMNEGVNTLDWSLWARIEKNFYKHLQQWNYQSGLGELNGHMQEFCEKRDHFNRLAAVVGIEVK